jgi:hypothetical protein
MKSEAILMHRITRPVGLKEAALDSPTFRATAVHFSDQVEVIERWLDGYLKSTQKLVNEVAGKSTYPSPQMQEYMLTPL